MPATIVDKNEDVSKPFVTMGSWSLLTLSKRKPNVATHHGWVMCGVGSRRQRIAIDEQRRRTTNPKSAGLGTVRIDR